MDIIHIKIFIDHLYISKGCAFNHRFFIGDIFLKCNIFRLVYLLVLLLPLVACSGGGSGNGGGSGDLPVPSSSCFERFGSTLGFVLCEEGENTCSFNADTVGRACDEICNNFGSQCLGALDNTGSSCIELPDNTDTCQTPRQTEICVCER